MSNLLSRELMEKAGAAGTAEELLALAKENGVNMSEDAAKEYFARIHKTGDCPTKSWITWRAAAPGLVCVL